MLDQVKRALRIGHNKLDSEFLANIAEARVEMSRLGIPETLSNSDDRLVNRAVVTYCLWINAADNQKDRYFEAWQYQLDCIRKSLEGGDYVV